MRSLLFALLMVQSLSVAQNKMKAYDYSSVKSPIPNPFASGSGLNEDDRFEFEKTFGTSGKWVCTEWGDVVMNTSLRQSLADSRLSKARVAELAKTFVTLTDIERNHIWDRPEEPLCLFHVNAPTQAWAFTQHFRRYGKKKIELPWYEGILSEVLGKLAPTWTVGKTAFDVFLERKQEDMVTAISLTALMATGGEFRRLVVLHDKDRRTFELVTEYAVQVGTEKEKRHILLYSILYTLQKESMIEDTKPSQKR